jgi:hypothetical protein
MVARGHVVTGGGGAGGDVFWGDVLEKPVEFPPEAHTHAQADVTGLDASLASKAPTGHTHAYADVTGKPATFPPTAHSHNVEDINGLSGTLTVLEEDVDAAAGLAGDAAQVFVWDPDSNSYALASGARIYLGTNDPGVGVLWINVDPS